MYTVRKVFKFEAAHQLQSAYSSCCKDTIHGHSYIVELFLRSVLLNDDGMVIDFGRVSDVVKPMIEKWDHALFLPHTKDEKQLDFLIASNKNVLIMPCNPTAENMAVMLFDEIKEALNLGPSNKSLGFPYLWKVRVHETATGWAEYQEVS